MQKKKRDVHSSMDSICKVNLAEFVTDPTHLEYVDCVTFLSGEILSVTHQSIINQSRDNFV